MHEREKDAAKIDIGAARINATAAELAELVDGRHRSAERIGAIGRFTRGELSDEQKSEQASLDREKKIAAEMASALQTIREASRDLQDLAQELRQPHVVGAT